MDPAKVESNVETADIGNDIPDNIQTRLYEDIKNDVRFNLFDSVESVLAYYHSSITEYCIYYIGNITTYDHIYACGDNVVKHCLQFVVPHTPPHVLYDEIIKRKNCPYFSAMKIDLILLDGIRYDLRVLKDIHRIYYMGKPVIITVTETGIAIRYDNKYEVIKDRYYVTINDWKFSGMVEYAKDHPLASVSHLHRWDYISFNEMYYAVPAQLMMYIKNPQFLHDPFEVMADIEYGRLNMTINDVQSARKFFIMSHYFMKTRYNVTNHNFDDIVTHITAVNYKLLRLEYPFLFNTTKITYEMLLKHHKSLKAAKICHKFNVRIKPDTVCRADYLIHYHSFSIEGRAGYSYMDVVFRRNERTQPPRTAQEKTKFIEKGDNIPFKFIVSVFNSERVQVTAVPLTSNRFKIDEKRNMSAL